MFVQISSGQGPVECQRVVWLVYNKMLQEFSSLKLVDHEAGFEKNCFKSMTLEASEDILAQIKSKWTGSLQWRGQSPFRPHHKRKNWFVQLSLISIEKSETFDPSKVEFEAFRAGGPGGQHVNKTSTAVRAVYTPTGDAVNCSEQRSQFQNRQAALLRLKQKLEEKNSAVLKDTEAQSRLLHYRLERGNPVLTFSGGL